MSSRRRFSKCLPEEEGQGLVEYALILVLVAIVVIAVLSIRGPQIGHVFTTVIGSVCDRPHPPSGCPRDSSKASATEASATEASVTEQAGNGSDVLEPILDFREQAEHQEESLGELQILLEEAFDESFEVLREHAGEIEDLDLYEALSDLQQEVESGNFAALPDVFVALQTALAEVPLDVQAAVVLKVEPLWIDSCVALQGTAVPFESFDEAFQAVAQLEAENPGSTGDAMQLLQEIWAIVEARNLFIEEGTGALIYVIDLGITWLDATGVEEYIVRAQQFALEAEGEGCTN
jgi:pilus assembly protein Flp/PilA